MIGLFMVHGARLEIQWYTEWAKNYSYKQHLGF